MTRLFVDLRAVRASLERLKEIARLHPELVHANNTDAEIDAWQKDLEEMERQDEEEKNRQTKKD